MEDEATLDLKDFWAIIVKRIKLILIITIASVLVTGILSYFVIPPVYEASTSIIIGKAPGEHNEKSQSNSNDVYMYQKLIKTYASIAKSDLVTDRTAKKMNSDLTGKEIKESITVTPQPDTQILVIKCENRDAKTARDVVNAVADAFIIESQRIYPTDNINVMDIAKLPQNPVKPKKVLNVAIAFFVGLMASVGLAFLLEYMDNTIKTEEDVERILNLPVLGLIPKNQEE